MKCTSCNAEIPKTAKFCPECGKPISTQDHHAERRQLTVMFCDVVNSTGLSAELDPEELRDLMRNYQDACAKVIQRFDGHIAKYLGDGLLVQFGYPVAHEDDAQRAVRAGIGMLEAVKFAHFHTPSGQVIPIDLRIGIHTGLVLVDEIGSEAQRVTDIVGDTPNLAARLQGLADPNALVISGSTQKLVAGFFELQELEPQSVKGIAQPIRVYRVQHESAARTRFEASRMSSMGALMGRSREMTLLQERWKETRSGHGHAIFLSGEAGIGKSRVALALKEYVSEPVANSVTNIRSSDDNGAAAWLVEMQCSPYYRNTAFYPVANFFERMALQFSSTDDAASKLAKLEGYLVQNGLNLKENIPLMQPLFSLPPHPNYPPLDPLSGLTKQRTMDLLLGLMMQRAREQPVLFVLEDLHWADPSTIELLGQLLPKISTSRILAMLSFRPEFIPPWDIPAERLALGRLPQEETRKMMEQVVRQKSLPPEIVDQILSKTDGVPLFIEELTRTIIESGSLVEKNDRYELASELKDVSVPTTLKDSLMARLDRMASSKRVAQLASVIGREFHYPLLEAIYPGDKGLLSNEFKPLVSSGLIFQAGPSHDALFIFKHALVQDVAYDSLLKTERQTYHLATATALRELFPDMYSGQPELVARHYTAANQVEQAIPEWLRAGKQADGRSANLEAGNHYRKGIELLSQLPTDSPSRGYELPLQLSYGMSMIMMRGYSVPEVETAITRARELCPMSANAPELPMVLWAYHVYNFVRGNLNVSVKIADEFLEVARRRNDLELLIESNSIFALERMMAGDFLAARKEYEECLARYDFDHHKDLAYRFTQDPLVVATILGSWGEAIMGNFDRAREVGAICLEHARKLGHTFSLNYAVAFIAWLYYWMDLVDEVERYASEALEIAQANGYFNWMGDALILLGWSKHRRGDSAGGLTLVQQGMGIFTAIGRRSGHPGILDLETGVLIALEQYDEARTRLDERWEVEARTNQQYRHSTGMRLEGELLRARTPTGEFGQKEFEQTRAFYQEAIDDARKRSARTFEMKALLSLLDLVRGTSEEAEVRKQIRALHATFTEGLDLPIVTLAEAALSFKE